jgi:hypothetical protein
MTEEKNSIFDPKSEIEKIEDAVFGSEKEFDENLALDIAETYDISPEELVEKIKFRMQAEVRRRSQNNEGSTENLIRAIRSIGNYQRKNSELEDPKSLIQKIRDGIDLNLRPSFAFRNKSKDGLSENDRQILKELENELDEE